MAKKVSSLSESAMFVVFKFERHCFDVEFDILNEEQWLDAIVSEKHTNEECSIQPIFQKKVIYNGSKIYVFKKQNIREQAVPEWKEKMIGFFDASFKPFKGSVPQYLNDGTLIHVKY